MASQAGAAEFLGVDLYIGSVNLGVAGDTDGLIETGIDLGVAIVTTKGRTVSFALVDGQ